MMTIPPLPADLALRASPPTDPPAVVARTAALLAEHQHSIWARTDRIFAHLLMFEWLAAIILAAFNARGRAGEDVASAGLIHPHVWSAMLVGAAIVAAPFALAAYRPGAALTRHAVGVGQILIGALLIELGGGRLEGHFHVFGSLAFLAFYRDWRVLATATGIVLAHHLAGSLAFPLAVYGVEHASIARTLEHGGWVMFLDVFLVVGCVRGVREMRGVARNRALLEASLGDVARQVDDRTRELADAQDHLVRAARSAGMAEIATSVLHNVGNVLNSVNVSATVVADRLRHSELPSLGQVSGLLAEHADDLGAFLADDDRGRLVPGFIAELSTCLQREHDAVLGELASLTRGVDHIKQIVAAQQSMAKTSTIRARVDPRKLMDDAVALLNPSQRRGIEFVRRYDAACAPCELDEHKVMQILVNLVTNACQASVERPGRARQVTLSIDLALAESACGPGDRVRFRVADNGVGIAPEHLARMFQHGFTTKKDGHGFGLHAAANAAREMRGALRAASAGPNQGATFTLEVPVDDDADTTNDQTTERACVATAQEIAHV